MRAMLLGLVLLLSSCWAHAQEREPICAPVEALTRVLREQFNELLVSSGTMAGGMRVLLFASEGGATWTVAVLAPSGAACVGPTGIGWRPHGRGI